MRLILKGQILKRITKTVEPKNLIEYRNKFSKEEIKNSDIYSGYIHKTKEDCYRDNENLRKILLEEQGYICCYCMSRISCDISKLEHFKPQSNYKSLQLDYKNLFVACKGGEGSQEQFCDTNKGNEELKNINLLEDIDNKIIYKKSRKEIVIDSEDKDTKDDLNDILNLNAKILKENRKEKFDEIMQKLKLKNFNKNYIQKTSKFFQTKTEGQYPEFCEMIVYYLEKKLRQKTDEELNIAIQTYKLRNKGKK